jgi:hypothetical protein
MQNFSGETWKKETSLEIYRWGCVEVDVNRSGMGGYWLD